jgi:hypothetical protein
MKRTWISDKPGELFRRHEADGQVLKHVQCTLDNISIAMGSKNEHTLLKVAGRNSRTRSQRLRKGLRKGVFREMRHDRLPIVGKLSLIVECDWYKLLEGAEHHRKSKSHGQNVFLKRVEETHEEWGSNTKAQQIKGRCEETLYYPSRSGEESESYSPLFIFVSDLLVVNETWALGGSEKSSKERKVISLALSGVGEHEVCSRMVVHLRREQFVQRDFLYSQNNRA